MNTPDPALVAADCFAFPVLTGSYFGGTDNFLQGTEYLTCQNRNYRWMRFSVDITAVTNCQSSLRHQKRNWRCLRCLSSKKFAGSRLLRRDDDLDCGVWPETVAVTNMMLCVPMPDATLHLAKKIETALFGQMSEIADQVCDGMLVTGAAVLLKNRDGLGGPGNVFDFICHARPSI
jgi:hypothetical protein